MRGRALAASLAVALALPNVVTAALFDDEEARRRIDVLRQQVEATNRAFEERMNRLEDRRPLVELASQLEAMRGELARAARRLEPARTVIATAPAAIQDGGWSSSGPRGAKVQRRKSIVMTMR